jgi:pantoate--beta-alanine ligase
MILFKEAIALSGYLEKQRKKGISIGFVPTMGALHQGHITLITASKKNTDLTVCSIFINPTQFNDLSDFKKYPVTIENDLKMLYEADADVVFLPEVGEIYPGGLDQVRTYSLGHLETILEGKYRPGHFQGVCQVVHRLLEIVSPEMLFMGQKDYQQCMVVQHLINIYSIPAQLVKCSTIREDSGLAMSSRNLRLSDTEREKAAEIYRTLQYVEKSIRPGNLSDIKGKAIKRLTDAGFRVDYLEICDARNLNIIDSWDGISPIVALTAAFLGDVRLIDNLVISGT